MELIVMGAVVVGLAGGSWLLWRWTTAAQRTKAEVFGTSGLKSKPLLTKNEVDFYRRLCRATQDRWVVLPQVSMGALMDTCLTPAHPRYWQERMRFAAKICDFVICRPSDMKPLLVVELDDVLHDFAKDEERDRLTAKAGYRTIRFWSRNKPTDAELRQEIDRVLALAPR